MTHLDDLVPEPRFAQIDHVDVAAPPDRAWEAVRNVDLQESPLARALFGLREIPARLRGERPPKRSATIDDIDAIGAPGFHILAEEPGREVIVGAIGKVWELAIPFVDVRDAAAFAAFREPGYAKVVWALRVEPREGSGSRVVFDLRVTTTDEESWKKFRRYFVLIGPFSHMMRRHLLAMVRRELGAAHDGGDDRPLPGDELLPDAAGHMTDSIAIAATPEAIWPWLVQMGCRRAGWYSYDVLDNAGVPSAREIHPELAHIAAGDRLPWTPESDEGFEVLRIDEPRVLLLGALYDIRGKKQLAFHDARPEEYFHMTWAFVLEPIDDAHTRLVVRVRASLSPAGRRHGLWGIAVHPIMEAQQLRNLAARAEGRAPATAARDVALGVAGAAGIVLDLLTPFLRSARNHWGLDRATAERSYPGDELVAKPRWMWTHGVEIDAPPEAVWPWIAQIGADRGGFYSYEWLENVAGCELHDAERVHPEWELREGDDLRLHPKMPPLKVVKVERGRAIVAHAAADERARAQGKPWADASWLFYVEPLPDGRCRFISRFRSDSSDDFATRLMYGPYVTEAVGFVMDRKMLLGVKERVERAKRVAVATPLGGERPSAPSVR